MGVCVGRRLPAPLWGQLPGEEALGWLKGEWPGHILPTSLLGFRQFFLIFHILGSTQDTFPVLFFHVACVTHAICPNTDSYSSEAGLPESWKKCFLK